MNGAMNIIAIPEALLKTIPPSGGRGLTDFEVAALLLAGQLPATPTALTKRAKWGWKRARKFLDQWGNPLEARCKSRDDIERNSNANPAGSEAEPEWMREGLLEAAGVPSIEASLLREEFRIWRRSNPSGRLVDFKVRSSRGRCAVNRYNEAVRMGKVRFGLNGS